MIEDIVVGAPAPPVEPDGKQKPKRRRKSRKRLLLGAAAVLLIAALAVGGWLVYRAKTADPVPASVQTAVLFPLYYPAELPNGYQIDQHSFSTNDQVVVFAAKNGSHDIAISEQAKPPGFDFNGFYTQRLSATQEVVTRSGDAVVGLMNNAPVASLVTAKTWVIVTFPGNMPANKVQQTVRSLSAAN